MLSRGIRAALSRRPRQWEADIFEKFEEEKNQQERELEAASQRAMLMQDRERSKLKEDACFVRDATAQKHDVSHHDTMKKQRDGHNEIQTNRLPVNIRRQHQESCLAPTSERDLWMQHPSIQAELAEFWAQRAQAREQYRKSKALGEATAMASTATRSARARRVMHPSSRAPCELAPSERYTQ
jgi:hypothetical protein